MTDIADLFPELLHQPKKRRSPRVLMRISETTINTTGASGALPFDARLQCPKCGHKTGWMTLTNVTEAKSKPCPRCNK